jgi:hypothetical protein
LVASLAAKAARPSRLSPAARNPSTRSRSISALIPTNTAARPTKECSAATSCGICVISTRRATTVPIAAPTSTMASISP